MRYGLVSNNLSSRYWSTELSPSLHSHLVSPITQTVCTCLSFTFPYFDCWVSLCCRFEYVCLVFSPEPRDIPTCYIWLTLSSTSWMIATHLISCIGFMAAWPHRRTLFFLPRGFWTRLCPSECCDDSSLARVRALVFVFSYFRCSLWIKDTHPAHASLFPCLQQQSWHCV